MGSGMKTVLAFILSLYAVMLNGQESLKNGDFSAQEKFAHWKFETIAPEVFDLKYDNIAKTVTMESLGADYAGYITQFVNVSPNTHYELRFRVKHSKGRCLIWVNGFDCDGKPLLFQERKYLICAANHPLAGKFVRKELMAGAGSDDWRYESLFFFTGDVKGKAIHQIKVNLGIYFSSAKVMFQDVRLIRVDK